MRLFQTYNKGVKCQNCAQYNPSKASICRGCGIVLIDPKLQPGQRQHVSFLIRLYGDSIDLTLVAFLTFLLSLIFIPPGSQWENTKPGYILWVVLFLVFFPLYEWLSIGLKGQTLGKKIFRIRVVNEAGGIPGLKVAGLRELLWKPAVTILIPVLFVSSAVLPSYGGSPKLNWNDKIAGTYTIKEKQKTKELASFKPLALL
jgi:uncharacterized RDD family membrane protein YckC